MNKLLDELAEKHDQTVPEEAVSAKMLAERLSKGDINVARRRAHAILYEAYQNGELKRKRIGNTWYYYEGE